MEELTLIQVKDFAIVAIALMGLIVLIGNVVKTVREWGRPAMSEREWRKNVDDALRDNSDRIETLEAGNKVIITALMAMLSHEINGNSIDKLRSALDELNQYLIDK